MYIAFPTSQPNCLHIFDALSSVEFACIISSVADISHKILRTDTVYDFLRELQRSGRGSFRDQAVLLDDSNFSGGDSDSDVSD